MTPFYAAGVPVLFLFTGAHEDYHRPGDTADKINAMGVVQVAHLARDVVIALSKRGGQGGVAPLSFRQASGPPPRAGDSRGGYGAYLGTIPDYTAMQGQKGGVKLSGARPGSPAATAGAAAGDILVGLGGHTVDTLSDLAFALRALKPGQKVELVLLRNGKRITQTVTLGSRPGQ
jgi:S1-C subfamily serine protease